jgi:site-specific DNA recombinase
VQGGLAQADFAQRRQLLELLIDRVVVTEDEVEIRYVVPLSPEGERRRFCHLRKDYLDAMALAVKRSVVRDGMQRSMPRSARSQRNQSAS